MRKNGAEIVPFTWCQTLVDAGDARDIGFPIMINVIWHRSTVGPNIFVKYAVGVHRRYQGN